MRSAESADASRLPGSSQRRICFGVTARLESKKDPDDRRHQVRGLLHIHKDLTGAAASNPGIIRLVTIKDVRYRIMK